MQGGSAVQRPWGGSACPAEGTGLCSEGLRGGWAAKPRRTWIYSDVLAVGGALWRPGVVLPAGCPRP